MSARETDDASSISHRTYLEMYRSRHGQYIQEGKLIEGCNEISMVRVSQPVGRFPDDPVSEYAITLNTVATIEAMSDRGPVPFAFP